MLVHMTAKLTITLSQDVLRTLRASKSITVALDSGAGGAGRAARAGGRAAPAGGGSHGEYREGSLPAKLMQWAKGRKSAFGVPDVMKKLRIKRGHASMLIAYVTRGGAVKRVGRGSYVAA
jgi:hypothetical protein